MSYSTIGNSSNQLSLTTHPERNQRMLRLQLPKQQHRNAAEPDHQHRNNAPILPLVLRRARDRERDEDEREDGDDEHDADDVELPEERDGKVARAEALEGRLVRIERAGLARLVTAVPEGEEEGEGAD